jgi:outer membrane protein OmpA-like peptidoglycan-associated protein
VSFGAEASLGGADAAAAAETPSDEDDEERARSLAEQISITGSTGLLRTANAGSAVAGTFRVGFLMDWFTTGGFLCSSDAPCNVAATEDDMSHVGAFFALNATPISFLEGYAGIRTYANSNDQATPALLQVLGDTTFGVKGFTPFKVAGVMSFGGDIRLLFLNGAGDVGVTGGGTSAEFMALTSADFRKPGAPIRVHLNLGYRLDNSGKLVEDVEILRAERNPAVAGGLGRIPISRIERYGLGINRVDFFLLRFGVDLPINKVQPYLEYTVDIPVNRQGYECHTRTLSLGDACLALRDITDQFSGSVGYSAVPSRLSLGVRTNPLEKAFRGLSAHLGFDIGLSATSTFIEEVAPQAPWTLYFGLGYAFDTKEKEVKAPPPAPLPPPPVQLPPPPEYLVRGLVKEKGTQNAVANAIVTVEGRADPPYATGADGRFLTRRLDPGTYTFKITAEGFKPGVCVATVQPVAPAPAPGMGGPQPGAPPGAPPGAQPPAPGWPPPAGPAPAPTWPPPGASLEPDAPRSSPALFGLALGAQPAPGQPPPWSPGAPPAAPPAPWSPGAPPAPPPWAPGAPPAPAPGAPPGAAPPGAWPPGQPPPGAPPEPGAAPAPPAGPIYTDVVCELEGLPKKGSVEGSVRDQGGQPAAGLTVALTDAKGKARQAATDAAGSFTFADVTPGSVKLRVSGGDYLATSKSGAVKAREAAQFSITVVKRPKNPNVKVAGSSIILSKRIDFEGNTAQIKEDSRAVIAELGDLLERTPGIKRIEIQGHTDNSGTADANMALSQDRANAVRDALVEQGVESTRVDAKGYGGTRPLAPNVTPANRARNRRVQVQIVDKE